MKRVSFISINNDNIDNKKIISSEDIANWVASCANIASVIQLGIDKPGLDLLNKNIDAKLGYLKGATILYKPIFDLASRGIMVEKGLIDIDEIDLGWIISETLDKNKDYNLNSDQNFGRLLLMSNLAMAFGYIISESNDKNYDISLDHISDITMMFLENSTPEDTVNLYKWLAENKNGDKFDILNITQSKEETIEILLETETNLKIFYEREAENNTIFKVLMNNYDYMFQIIIPEIDEMLKLKKTESEIIIQIHILLMAEFYDSSIYQKYGRNKASKIRQKAKEIISNGSIFTNDGLNSIRDLREYLIQEHTNDYLKIIDELTIFCTFLALLLKKI